MHLILTTPNGNIFPQGVSAKPYSQGSIWFSYILLKSWLWVRRLFFYLDVGVVGGIFLSLNLLIKILRIFLIVGHPRDPKEEDHGYLTTFRGINAPKSGPFKYENNAQTLPKQL